MDFKAFKRNFDKTLYDDYRVTLHLIDIAGGTPAHPDMIKGWIDATNKEKSEAERQALKDATAEELPELATEKEEKSWVRFKRDDKGIYVEGRCIKAALKEAANIVKNAVKTTDKKGNEVGSKALKSKFAECVFVAEDRIHVLTEEGDPVTEAQSEERPVHVMTAQGPRTSLKRSEVLYDVKIIFTVQLAKTGAVSEKALFSALAYLDKLGIGADRSQGRGRSRDIEVEKVEG